jgi:hypothetical protein
MSCRGITAIRPRADPFMDVLMPDVGGVPRRAGRSTMPYAIDFNGADQNIKFAVPSRNVMFAPI